MFLENETKIKKNFIINLLDGGFFSFGMSFVAMTTILPLFVKNMGGNNIAVGLIPVIWTIGFHFPQIFVAHIAQKIPLKKKIFLRTALWQRLPWFFLAVISYMLVAKLTSSFALLLFFIGFGFAAITNAINLPFWFDLISKITPTHLRGRLFAYRSILGSLLGIAGGYCAKVVLDKFVYPNNYALLFVLSFVTIMFSYIFLLFLKEENPDPVVKIPNYKKYIRSLPKILFEDRNYRNFLIVDSLLILAMVAEAFFTIHAVKRFNLSEGYAGFFIMIMMVSMIISNLIFGIVADRFGHKINLILTAIFTTAACLIATFSTSVKSYYLVFVLIACVTSLKHISRLTIIAEICFEKERSTYVALTNFITSPFILFGILAGWLTEQFDFTLIFVLSAIFAGVAAYWLIRNFKEPRKQTYPLVFQVNHIKL